MLKIVIVCWYDREWYIETPNCINTARDTFIAKNIDTVLFPFLQIKLSRNDYIDYLNTFLKEKNPDIVLWWNWSNITLQEMEIVRKKNSKRVFMIYNWDDPPCWENNDLEIMKYFDISFSSCISTLDRYKKHGVKICKYLLPGFSPMTHYYEKNKDYECDVSFVCTNLYEKHNTLINRKKMCIDLENDESINFHLYGPEFLKEIAPKSYRGSVEHEINRLVFSNSKININVHIDSSSDGYLNERSIIIPGCGGLMLIDDVKGLEKNFIQDKECIVIKNQDTIIEQIKDILDNYQKNEKIKYAGYEKVIKNHLFDKWCDFIINTYNEFIIKKIIINNVNINKNELIKEREKNKQHKVIWILSDDILDIKYSKAKSIMTIIRTYVCNYGDTIKFLSCDDKIKEKYAMLICECDYDSLEKKYKLENDNSIIT
uniref:Spore protein YkvP/CgeB glycosyl transferase-like domain-containing protein n=1 Tax=viral metagenome TaxID=1070528 RepID=A0A6C0DYW6_9ZZZZ